MSIALEGLIQGQVELFGRISRAYDNLRKVGSANITLGLVEARLQTLEANWAKFEAQHDKLVANHWAMIADLDYQKKDMLSTTEEAFVNQKGLFLDAVRALKGPTVVEARTDASSTHIPSRTTLPRIQLPQFSGRYEDWPSFRDLFQSMIAKDRSTTPVEKLHYLKSCLKGEAESLIRTLPTTDENFSRAWKTLTDFYENKRLIVRSFISKFTTLPKLKGESATDLRKLYHGVRSVVDSFESIGRPITSGEDLFVHLVADLLDSRSRREWENLIGTSTEPPAYGELLQFLERRLHTLASLQSSKSEPDSPKSSTTRQARTLLTRKKDGKRGRCSLCQQDHFVMLCPAFQGKSPEERKKHVEANNLCFNCLGKHKLSDCSSTKTCSACNGRHHTSLHDACQADNSAKISHLAQRPIEVPANVLLATARVRVMDKYGNHHTVRALIDQGSETSLIAETLVQRLRLPRQPSSVSVYGIGGKHTGFARGQVSLRMTARNGGPPMFVSAFVLPRLTLYDGGLSVAAKSWDHLSGLDLADPDFLRADSIDLLLGADVYGTILLEGLRKGGPREPVAQRTSIGWILSGILDSTAPKRESLTHHCRTEEDLTALIQRFWQQEELPFPVPALGAEDKECEEIFRRTHTRDQDGRFIVRLPVKASLPDLAATRRSAVRVLHSVEARFEKDAQTKQLYVDFMQQYEDLLHMSPVPAEESTGARISYLPHHGVMRESSTTTRLRVVFNGSTKGPTGESLNNYLLTGPNLLPALTDVLLRWRRHRYVLATDVEKMYRQILVHPEERDLQRIVWRYNREEDIREYRLNTVTYGLACAPYLAMRTLRQLAEDEASQYPRGAEALCKDVYMDDILTGAATRRETSELQQQLIGLCTAGGFPLRKWSSNEPSILKAIPVEHRLQRDLLAWGPADAHSTLGLRWHPATDSFSFSTRSIKVTAFTKRSILSLTAQLFDPLGWLAPTVVYAKIAFQSTWLRGIGWDDPLDTASRQLWSDLQDELPTLEQIRVPRWIQSGLVGVELHGFSDASERAYAAVVYLRVEESGAWRTKLVTAKTKVAPLKQVTLPRLELCAATLLSKIVSHVRVVLDLKDVPVQLWTDSTVVLGWIRGHPTRWTTYVANRVSEIQTAAPDALWRHIPGRDNPADCASRGLTPEELVRHELWWGGPSWLAKDSSSWPGSAELTEEAELPEFRARIHAATAEPLVAEPKELLRFSTLNRLLRVTAWCRRWLLRKNPRAPPLSSGSLDASELDEARISWIRIAQSCNFKIELSYVTQGRTLPKSNALTRLCPFADSRGILRVGGRLKHSILSYDERHPIILPFSSHLTRLIIEAFHRRTLHGGAQLTLGMIRRQYWIPRGRSLVKRLILGCVPCVRWRAAIPQQLMGNLPKERVRPSRPFLHTGVDYAGPIRLRTTKGRGHRSYKAFIAVFVCLSTRAVHLEAVSDYTADAFLAALRRFTSRRGLCSTLHSDCGTNFVGADSQLKALFAACSSDRRRIITSLAGDGIQWRFNPPGAPHFGGIWEAAVKSLKHHVRRVLGEATLTFEEMSTLLAQIEACLNSRPLRALSDDPDDLTALTPGHFLIGSALVAVPEPSLRDEPSNRLSRWQLIQQIRDHFWERWAREYLHTLAHRPKWWNIEPDLEVGRLCLVRNETTPPARWPLGRIVRVHPGDDGQVRVVTVRTASSEFKRPIVKIVLLPVRSSETSLEAQDDRAEPCAAHK